MTAQGILAVTDTPQEEFVPGYRFSIEVETEAEVQKVRDFVKEKTGRAPHLEVRIGPWVQGPTGLSCQFKAIDDKFLDGNYNQFPRAMGGVVYVGRLL